MALQNLVGPRLDATQTGHGRSSGATPQAFFATDIKLCRRCGGRLRVIVSIEDPVVIERVLGHLGRDGEFVDPAHRSRAPPERDRLI